MSKPKPLTDTQIEALRALARRPRVVHGATARALSNRGLVVTSLVWRCCGEPYDYRAICGCAYYLRAHDPPCEYRSAITDAGRAVVAEADRLAAEALAAERAAQGTVTVPRWALAEAVRWARQGSDERAALEAALKGVER